MIASIATWLIAKGISERLARPLIFLALGLLVVGALAGGKCAYDRSVIERHEDKRAVTDLKTIIKRERKANAEDVKAEARDEAVADTIEKGITDAVEAHPEEAAASVGPAVQSVLDELRRQRASGQTASKAAD